jgi:hypothetical protein
MEAHYGATAPRSRVRRLATETKHALKTTEFWVYVAFLLAVLIAGTVDNSEGTQFGADDVWLYATIATAAYLISRGLAKSGSRDPYWDDPNAGGDDGSLTDRVKEAAQVLTDGGQAGQDPEPTTRRQGPLAR